MSKPKKSEEEVKSTALWNYKSLQTEVKTFLVEENIDDNGHTVLRLRLITIS
jgi:hypothetical protein